MRRLLAPLLLTLTWWLPAAPASAATDCLPECGPVVVVGVPGLRWTDVGPATPTLQRLARDGAAGVLSVKGVPAVSCPADGWLTLGAGNRAVAAGVQREPCGGELPDRVGPSVQANAAQREGAELGALVAAVDTLEQDRACVSLDGPGPVLAAAGQPPAGRRASTGPCPVQLRETPPVVGQGTGRVARAVAADRAVAAFARGAGTLIIVGLSEGPGEDTARLHVAIAHGPAFAPGALVSASTRRAPYVQLVDVAPTVLDLVGVEPPASMSGEPWRSVGEAPTPQALADLAQKAAAQKAATVPFFVLLLAVPLALIALLLRFRRPDLAEPVALGATAAVGASYAANLVPWWRSPAPLLTLVAVVVVLSTAVVVLVLSPIFASCTATRGGSGPQDEDRRGVGRGVLGPVGLVCAFVAAVLLLDLVTGARLQMSSVGGYSPLVAGRFAGIGNVAFGVLAASVLLATAALTRRVAVVAAVGVLTVLLDGAPPWGSDVGGVLALVPAFVLLAMLVSGRRVTLVRLAAAGLAGAAVVTAFALLDWSRVPQDRTHLGRFVQDVADGTAGTLLARKADAVLGLLFASPVTALLPLVVAAAVYLVVRPPAPLALAFARAPAWRQGLLSVGLASAIGFAVNDSGAAVPALAIVVLLPATVAVVLRARRAEQEDASLLA